MTDPATHPDAQLIREIHSDELKQRNLASLPFDRIVLDLLEHSRLLKKIQIVNGLKPELVARALAGEHVGTIIHAPRPAT